MKFCVVVWMISVFLICVPATKGNVNSNSTTSDVMVGRVEFIDYSRAYAFLDGLFQDVAAIQIADLTGLDPNSPNATNLDAVIQQFQASIQYSQTMGIQNAAVAQQSAAFSANMALEAQIIKQESQLLNLALTAQLQVSQAQAALDAIPPASVTERENASKALQLAKDNLTSINAQITLLKSLRASPAPSSQQPSNFVVPSPSPVSFPTPSITPSLPKAGSDSNPFVPSYSASKKMDNQISLLSERLANLLNTISQAEKSGNVYLLKFNTSILAGKGRKKSPLLTTHLKVACRPAAGAAALANEPRVLDLFPRNAAVNIVDQKYRNSRFGLGGLLSFFSIGLNASYNREQLRISQALSQSSYITGFGIQSNEFGWVFGPSLGEVTPAPGPRTTFALVEFPKNCGTAKVELRGNTWNKEPSPIEPNKPSVNSDLGKHRLVESPADSCGSQPADGIRCIERISYTPTEFGTSIGGASSSVTVHIKLNSRFDREQNVYVNGDPLSRTRDKYGRGTRGDSAGGLLQTAALSQGTWFPISG